jgi:hypothetical protein
MKKIRGYHIEAYWAEEAAKRERMDELKQKFKDGFWIGAFCVLEVVITFELLRQIFEVI